MAETTTVNKLVINDVISFNTYGIVLNNVVDGTLLGFTSGKSLRDPAQAAVNHANIYSSLPNTPSNPTINDYTSYNYLVIELVDNSIIEIGIPWINPVSLTRLVRQTATIILTDVDPATQQSIVDMLVLNGYVNYTINFN